MAGVAAPAVPVAISCTRVSFPVTLPDGKYFGVNYWRYDTFDSKFIYMVPGAEAGPQFPICFYIRNEAVTTLQTQDNGSTVLKILQPTDGGPKIPGYTQAMINFPMAIRVKNVRGRARLDLNDCLGFAIGIATDPDKLVRSAISAMEEQKLAERSFGAEAKRHRDKADKAYMDADELYASEETDLMKWSVPDRPYSSTESIRTVFKTYPDMGFAKNMRTRALTAMGAIGCGDHRQEALRGTDVVPKSGDVLVIIPGVESATDEELRKLSTKDGTEYCNFHAAYVMYADAHYYITVEANAGQVGLPYPTINLRPINLGGCVSAVVGTAQPEMLLPFYYGEYSTYNLVAKPSKVNPKPIISPPHSKIEYTAEFHPWLLTLRLSTPKTNTPE